MFLWQSNPFDLIDNQVRHQGWSISLFSPNGGLAYIEHLGLLEEFAAISFQPCFRALDGETGSFSWFIVAIQQFDAP